ncbi:Asp-tRNA(Asn)/Glu-tRNA(Gln) amidotransferase subunit GatC [Cellulosilyticum sp. I15G10I2]|uniref:Asp-tRNA(Asn)/Glu-tRNA(Gln) amidotransferase subunit GatC n=1 Tax=Cellulosilyticum sp. I15G10I2 TaxID=1892843 RepID=UPI00085C9DA5|nr:Asp-tRNA(Asn)/Glu-tRNA(Gln) amidotransferase subunit GatC [Cellulosilyticum sp. I15G10I2]
MLDTDLITYLAKLSKLQVDDADKERLVSEMSAIVDLMDTMNDVAMGEDEDLKGEGVSPENLREDKSRDSFDREKILQNASHKKDGFFVVPKIME